MSGSKSIEKHNTSIGTPVANLWKDHWQNQASQQVTGITREARDVIIEYGLLLPFVYADGVNVDCMCDCFDILFHLSFCVFMFSCLYNIFPIKSTSLCHTLSIHLLLIISKQNLCCMCNDLLY